MDANELAKYQMIMTVIVTIANIFLVLLTGIYVYLTRRIVQEARSNRDPIVFVDLEFPDTEARVAIGNTGQTPALNIKFDIQEDVPWRGVGKLSDGLKNLDIIHTGVSYLPFGRTLKYSAGFPDWDKINDGNKQIKVRVSYENENRKKFVREYYIDLGQYNSIRFDSFRDPSMAIAKVLYDIERSRTSRESGDKMFKSMGFNNLNEKRCSMCAELIPKAAKKCSHCGELLQPVENA